jgi:single-stranded-DNA-specific exonuclease
VREFLLVVPDLMSIPEASGTAGGPLGRVLRFGATTPLAGGWRAWLAGRLARLDLVGLSPAAVVAAAGQATGTAGAGPGAGDGCWLATPLHLVAGLDTLHLPRDGILSLAEHERAALAQDFDATLGGDGLSMQAVDGDALLLRGLDPGEVVTSEPATCLGADLVRAQPAGPGAMRLRRLMAEIEMWLHEHPVNRRREREGQKAVRSLWLWGGEARVAVAVGCVTRGDRPAGRVRRIHSADAWVRAAARLAAVPLAPAGEAVAAGDFGAAGDLIATASLHAADPPDLETFEARPSLHPVLARAYAARGVAAAASSNSGSTAAAGRHARRRRGGPSCSRRTVSAAGGRRRRRFRRRRRDQHGADRARAARLGFRGGRASSCRTASVRLRPDAGDRRLAAEREPALIVTVDNGISSHAGVAAARGARHRRAGHRPPPAGAELPDATVIVNPNVRRQPLREPRARRRRGRVLRDGGAARGCRGALPPEVPRRWSTPSCSTWSRSARSRTSCRWTATTACSCRRGCGASAPALRARHRALLEVAGRNGGPRRPTDLGFFLGPRLNAAGRLDDMSIGIRCLLTDDAAERWRSRGSSTPEQGATRDRDADAGRGARRRARQSANRGAKLPARAVPVRPGWHQGVVGLVASARQGAVHPAPVIAFARRGRRHAARLRALGARRARARRARCDRDARARLLEKFGGHAMAAGMTLQASNLARFSRAFAPRSRAARTRRCCTASC